MGHGNSEIMAQNNGGSENGVKMAKIAAMAYQRGGMAWRRGSQREMAASGEKYGGENGVAAHRKSAIGENNNESMAHHQRQQHRVSHGGVISYQRRAAWRRRNGSVSAGISVAWQRNGISGVAASALRMA
jgi:hypothetical protein